MWPQAKYRRNFHYRGATVYVAAGQISQKLSAKEIYLLCRSATVYVTRQCQIYAETESNENELVQTALLFSSNPIAAWAQAQPKTAGI